jgi:mannitol-1-/sugar-/sorbitol-6-/2-deoxyglucose-6-phosphatase
MKISNMYKAVVFDMDGVIIDSEPLWRKAYINIFERYGVRLTDDQLKQSQGLRVDEEVSFLYSKYKLKNLEPELIRDSIKNEVKRLINLEGRRMQGLDEVISLFKYVNLRLALASSSDYDIIDTVLRVLELDTHFEMIHSAEEEPYGKPHPGVYITTAGKMNVLPISCIAIEDSLFGVIAAKAARMACIAVPEGYPEHDKRFIIADKIVGNLNDIDKEFIDEISYR